MIRPPVVDDSRKKSGPVAQAIQRGSFMSSETGNSAKLATMHHVAVPVPNVKEAVDWYIKNFDCKLAYQDETWALVEFANVSLAFVLPAEHPPHIAMLGDPAEYGEPKTHRDGTRSVYVKDPAGNNIEILALR
jgi:catechol 2,3-dioxygenase-like lactoylglutathione lyase family enzyme